MRRRSQLLLALAIAVVAGCGAGKSPTLTYAPLPSPLSVASPTPWSSPSPMPSESTAWTTHTSLRNGFALDLPPGWTDAPATEDWPADTYPVGGSPYIDQFAGPPGPFPVIDIVTRPFGDTTTAEAFLAWLDIGNGRICTVEKTDSVSVDGIVGRLQLQNCGYSAWEVVLIGDGRVTIIY